MRQMFENATLKLTASYLIILMFITITFSVVIFELSSVEINRRLDIFQSRIESVPDITFPGTGDIDTIRTRQQNEANLRLFFGLLYTNLLILFLGGAGSYMLARRTLKPIERAHEEQSRFTSDASHELRTPLAIMKSEIEVGLADKRVSKTEMRELLESNLEEVNKLADLSTTLLNLAKLEHHKIVTDEKITLTSIIQNAEKLVDPHTDRIRIKAPKQTITVKANQTSIAELVAILLDNALKYSPKDSTVTVRLSSSGRNASIAVENKGEGIPEKEISHIFDRFYRVDKARTTSGDKTGYGLGLPLARRIAELHGGVISATSTPGKTTVFQFTMPKS